MKNRLYLKETNILDESTKQKLLEKRNTKLLEKDRPYPIFDLTKCDQEIINKTSFGDMMKTLDQFKLSFTEPPNYIFAPYVPKTKLGWGNR
jgi:hypothetical protein